METLGDTERRIILKFIWSKRSGGYGLNYW